MSAMFGRLGDENIPEEGPLHVPEVVAEEDVLGKI